MKRRTTPRGRSTPTRTACSLLALLLAAAPAAGQSFEDTAAPPYNPAVHVPTPPAESAFFHRQAPAAPGSVTLYYERLPTITPPPAPAYAPAATFTPVEGEMTGVRQVAWQPPAADGVSRPGAPERRIQTDPPGPERLFRLESEKDLKERMRQEARLPGHVDRIVFPEEPGLPGLPYAPRRWAPTVEQVEPNYVAYKRLYFEQKNSERYGWELSFLQPFISAGGFYADVLILPYKMGTDPFRHYESNAGYCLPGDPVPYMIYPPQWSLTGLATQGLTVTGLAIAFP